MKNYSSLLIGGKQFSSRLMVGTGKYKSTQDMTESLSNSEIIINRKMLAQLALNDPKSFETIVSSVSN